MKKLLLSLSVIALSLINSSCDSKSRLADELNGTWTASPQSISDNSAISATLIETYEFNTIPASESGIKNGGTIDIVGMLSASTQIIDSNNNGGPLELTASARSTITGTWQVIDDDEVLINLDPATLSIEVDPDAVVPGSASLADDHWAKITELKPTIINMLASGLRQSLSNRYASLRTLDDVKIQEPMLKFEIGDMDYVFTRQGGSK